MDIIYLRRIFYLSIVSDTKAGKFIPQSFPLLGIKCDIISLLFIKKSILHVFSLRGEHITGPLYRRAGTGTEMAALAGNQQMYVPNIFPTSNVHISNFANAAISE